jgi:hypothetical protein
MAQGMGRGAQVKRLCALWFGQSAKQRPDKILYFSYLNYLNIQTFCYNIPVIF